MTRIVAFCIFLLLVASAAVLAAQTVAEQWKADVRETGLSPTEITALANHDVIVTNTEYKQVFTPYLHGSPHASLFITTDSLLNAYHVLYEESVFRLETHMAGQLPAILRFIVKNVEDADKEVTGNPLLVAAAKTRAKLVVGIALRLLDDSFRFHDEKLDAIVSDETQTIIAAQAISWPQWLGKPAKSSVAFDYSRYKPRGFYASTASLQRYFRAVSWLQSIPFRLDNDEEFLAMLMLGNSITYERFTVNGDASREGEYYEFFRTYSSLIGAGDDWDIMTAAQEAQNTLELDLSSKDALHDMRANFLEQAKDTRTRAQINDQFRFAPDSPDMAAEPQFRIVSAHRLPCAVLFQRLLNAGQAPSGLAIGTAIGSSCARNHVKSASLPVINANTSLFHIENLYGAYLHMLTTLFATPVTSAPDFMRSNSWQIKSCNTAMSGWAQMRHTWALQAKENVEYLGLTRPPSGFVEPNPDFYDALADLAAETKGVLHAQGDLAPDYTVIADDADKLAKLYEGIDDKKQLIERFLSSEEDLMGQISLPIMLMQVYNPMMPPTDIYGLHAEHSDTPTMSFKQQHDWLAVFAQDLRNGNLAKYPNLTQLLARSQSDISVLWDELEQASRRCEIIALKQLNHQALNARDDSFIKSYGATLAGIMLYGGNSYLTPKDDAPRVIDVCVFPGKGYLEVGIARPRAMYLLYPWQGKQVLCLGAVLPYQEFISTTRLTDMDWRARLDSPQRPAMPSWLQPLMGNQVKGH